MDENRKPGYLALIPAEVRYDTTLAPNAKLLYGEITALAGADGFCWASNEYFSRLYQMDKRTISRLIGQLQELGHIQVEMVRKNGGAGPIEYRKIFIGRKVLNASLGIDKNVYTPRQKCREGMDKNVQEYKGELTRKNVTLISPEGMALFERFWEAYPKKKAKSKARQAWVKLKPDMELCKIMAAALDQQKRSETWKREDGRFIPYPATWLNQRRWEDEPDKAAPVLCPVQEKGGAYGWQ